MLGWPPGQSRLAMNECPGSWMPMGVVQSSGWGLGRLQSEDILGKLPKEISGERCWNLQISCSLYDYFLIPIKIYFCNYIFIVGSPGTLRIRGCFQGLCLTSKILLACLVGSDPSEAMGEPEGPALQEWAPCLSYGHDGLRARGSATVVAGPPTDSCGSSALGQLYTPSMAMDHWPTRSIPIISPFSQVGTALISGVGWSIVVFGCCIVCRSPQSLNEYGLCMLNAID